MSAVIPIRFVIRMIVGIAALRVLLVNVFFYTLNKDQSKDQIIDLNNRMEDNMYF